VGFGPFSHLTCAPQVFEIPTHDSNANVENRRVSGVSARVFLVGLVGRVGFLGDFQPRFKQKHNKELERNINLRIHGESGKKKSEFGVAEDGEQKSEKISISSVKIRKNI
jgi:hypothetical protein